MFWFLFLSAPSNLLRVNWGKTVQFSCLEVWITLIDHKRSSLNLVTHNVHDSKTYTECYGAHYIDTGEGGESLTVGLVVGGPTNNPVLTYFLRVYILSVSF